MSWSWNSWLEHSWHDITWRLKLEKLKTPWNPFSKLEICSEEFWFYYGMGLLVKKGYGCLKSIEDRVKSPLEAVEGCLNLSLKILVSLIGIYFKYVLLE